MRPALFIQKIKRHIKNAKSRLRRTKLPVTRGQFGKVKTYKNKRGETFFVERGLENENVHERTATHFVNIKRQGEKLSFGQGILGIDYAKRSIEIRGLGIYDPEEVGKGRNILGIMIDECKSTAKEGQIKKPYTIEIYTKHPITRRYYVESGFKEVKGKDNLVMKI